MFKSVKRKPLCPVKPAAGVAIVVFISNFFWGVVVLARVDQVSSHAFGCALSFVDSGAFASWIIWHSMESLILAQDERWRRA